MEPGVPRSLATAAAIVWRVLVVLAAVILFGLAIAHLRLVVLPVFAALLLTTFLAPPTAWLREKGLPNVLAALVSLLGALAVVGGLTAAVAPQVAGEVDELDVSVTGGVERVQSWLVDGPLGLSEARVGDLVDQAEEQLREGAGTLASGALTGTVIAVEVLVGLVLALVLVFFFLKDGERIWSFLVGLFPEGIRTDVRGMGDRAWQTLGGFLRGTAIVAFVDAFFIGLALFLLGVPLVIPLAVLTFFGAFVPIVGAFVAGFASAMVALVSKGLTAALIVVAATVVIQQLEGNLLQPVIVGRSVELHAMVVILAVTTGAVLWGVLGAFVAVPLTAATWSAMSYLRERPPRPGRRRALPGPAP